MLEGFDRIEYFHESEEHIKIVIETWRSENVYGNISTWVRMILHVNLVFKLWIANTYHYFVDINKQT